MHLQLIFWRVLPWLSSELLRPVRFVVSVLHELFERGVAHTVCTSHNLPRLGFDIIVKPNNLGFDIIVSPSNVLSPLFEICAHFLHLVQDIAAFLLQFVGVLVELLTRLFDIVLSLLLVVGFFEVVHGRVDFLSHLFRRLERLVRVFLRLFGPALDLTAPLISAPVHVLPRSLGIILGITHMGSPNPRLETAKESPVSAFGLVVNTVHTLLVLTESEIFGIADVHPSSGHSASNTDNCDCLQYR